MTSRSTTNTSKSLLNLKLGLYNVENLFLVFDQPIPPNYQSLTEPEWAKLSNSVYEPKLLSKCLQLGQIINENNPDIMMLCEVGGLESLNTFNKLFLNNEYNTALVEGNSDRNIDVGFLIKKNTPGFFDLISNKKKPLGYLYPHENTSKKTGYPIKSESQYFSRDCAELHLFKTNKDEPYLILLLTHLKSRLDPERIDPGGTDRRSAELRACIDIYKKITTDKPNTPILFAGDMNGFAGKPKTDTEFLPLYLDTDLEDVLELSGVNTDKRSTFYQIKNSGKSEGKQIDYCFLGKHLQKHLQKDSAFIYRYKDIKGIEIDQPRSHEAKSRLASDHYPLFFILENLPY